MKTPPRYQRVLTGDGLRIAKREKLSAFKRKRGLLHL
jgi:hypothetical protein